MERGCKDSTPFLCCIFLLGVQVQDQIFIASQCFLGVLGIITACLGMSGFLVIVTTCDGLMTLATAERGFPDSIITDTCTSVASQATCCPSFLFPVFSIPLGLLITNVKNEFWSLDWFSCFAMSWHALCGYFLHCHNLIHSVQPCHCM